MVSVELILFILLIVYVAISIYEYRLIRKSKKLLSAYENMRKKLFETSEKISKATNEEEIYSIALDTVTELIPNATKGSILLFDEENEVFYYKVVKGFREELTDFIFRKEEVYLYKINGFSKSAIIKNPKEFDIRNANKEIVEGLESVNALDISCTMAAPIYADDRLIGLINVDSVIPGHTFTERDLEFMDQIKFEMELAIRNALAQNKLKYLADYDELTGLINRRLIKKEFDMELERLNIDKNPFCLAMIDIDDFKAINDTYGHYYGDMVLKHFAAVLRRETVTSDVVARFAGDEFIVLFRDQNIALAEIKMEGIATAVLESGTDDTQIMFSYGICEINDKNIIGFDKALAIADMRMYANKKVKA